METDMAMGRVRGWSLLSAALMGTTALTLVGPAAAQSKVGVTSATDGDPLGKPPAENERVLRIGIDVQANEVITTRANDRAHLVFLDGTALTVGPEARLIIDKFVYDPNTKTGDLAITASQGVLRLVGGKISKTNPITINTPAGTIGIRGGIGMFGIGGGKTTAAFLFGNSMTVTGGGQTQTMTRPNSFSVINNGGSPSLPSLLPPGGLNALIGSLSLANNNSGNSGSGGGGGNADSKAQSSGFSGSNSGGQPGGPPTTGNPPNVNNNTFTQAVSNTNGTSNPLDITATTTTTTTTTGNTTPKTSQTLKGFVGGLVVETVGSHSTTHAPNAIFSKPGDLTIRTNATTSTVTATVIVRGIDGSIFSPTNANLVLGVTSNGGNSFFQDNVTFLTGTTNGTGTVKPQFGGYPIPISNTTFVATTAAIGQAVADGQMIAPQPYTGSGSCTCDFLTFGYWQTAVTYPNHYGPQKTEVVTQAPWVAGLIATQLPNTGSASFSGVMLGQAQNAGGGMRNVTGSYGMNYSWGAGAGSVTASFDNRNYVGGVVSTGGANFAGGMVGGNRVGTMAGAFNTSSTAGGAVVGQSGQFGIAGPGYVASGIFAGAKQ
jgi:hypothetical protein